MASTYLQRTNSSGGNRRTFTFSCWIKRSALSSSNDFAIIEGANDTTGNYVDRLEIENDSLAWVSYHNSSDARLITNRLLRDTSAWYHIVLAVDTTQATASNRIKLYINGEQETSFSTSNYMSQNYDTYFNVNSKFHRIGGRIDNVEYFDGSMAHVHFIDGTAYAASTFGETDSTSGIWKPKTGPSVTYGTNGFFLKFQDSSSLGDDSSGNTNDFTLSGSGTQTLDTPSNVFATLNALHKVDDWSLSNGNLKHTNTSTGSRMINSTLAVFEGKFYCEVKMGVHGNESRVGVIDPDKFIYNTYIHNTGRGYAYKADGSTRFNNAVTDANYGDSFTTGDIIGIAMDLDNHKLYFSKNGVWQNSGDPTSGSTGTGSAFNLATGVFYSFGASSNDQGSDPTMEFNFGNGYFGTTAVSSAENDDAGYGKFEYDVPTGYYALCTKNINTYG